MTAVVCFEPDGDDALNEGASGRFRSAPLFSINELADPAVL